MTHLRAEFDVEGRPLQSTGFSKIEIVTTTEEVEGIEVVGVLESAGEGMLELLLADGKSPEIAEELWGPFEEHLEKGKLFVNVKMENNKIVEIRAVQKKATDE
ncbi:hypothetical protein GOODEAATRI_033309 [Goodea atripinnis]|uniref:Uncharacterized protein n=1 Tax=Goodea atripinnis TaxID=208336 RepID=A0ABV0NRU3_9TELE